jgi:hypothetical protein
MEAITRQPPGLYVPSKCVAIVVRHLREHGSADAQRFDRRRKRHGGWSSNERAPRSRHRVTVCPRGADWGVHQADARRNMRGGVRSRVGARGAATYGMWRTAILMLLSLPA